jgi:meso-butanediol dehydrogenase/(S,S)-butanediol dehydrogenase/diacetyl reductase
MAVAIITGAGSGIGAATARALSDRGDHIVCADVKLDAAKQISASLLDAIAVEVDVSSAASCDRMVEEAMREFGDVNSIVTCAGVEKHGLGHEFSEEDFDWIIGVNLKGTWLSARAAVRARSASSSNANATSGASSAPVPSCARAAFVWALGTK